MEELFHRNLSDVSGGSTFNDGAGCIGGALGTIGATYTVFSVVSTVGTPIGGAIAAGLTAAGGVIATSGACYDFYNDLNESSSHASESASRPDFTITCQPEPAEPEEGGACPDTDGGGGASHPFDENPE
jgi:hypothetical protein